MADTGGADARLVAALAALQRAPGAAARAEVLAALAGARVYVPVTSRSEVSEVTGGATAAEPVLLTLVGSAGGRAVPLFLDLAAAVAFRPGARPVPTDGPEACRAALDDGAVTVLLDPPGTAVALTAGELRELASGRVPVPGAALSARRTTERLTAPDDVDEALLVVVGDALRGEPVAAARLLQGPDGPVLGLVPAQPLDAAGLAELAGRVLPRVGRPDLALAVVPVEGPGTPVPLRVGWWARLRRR